MQKLFILIVATLFTNTIKAQPAFITDSIEQYITKGMADWQIPGLSIVIVKDGQVVLRKGYGVTDLKTNAPVNENTLFMIASNTKLFTGTALANLEHYGKLNLDDKITKYLPTFTLADKNNTNLATIRDMLSHRIGTTTFQGDYTFWNTKFTRQQIIDKMRLLKPSNPFRQTYGYCNSCFLTAGQIIPAATKISWEQMITDTFIKPLQMANTFALSNDIETRANRMLPHTTVYTNTLQQVPYDEWDNLAPAASMVSNVKDLTNWLQFQIDGGKYNGQQIIPYAVLQKTRDINTIVRSRKSSVFPTQYSGYGLGVFNTDYNGTQIYHHTGGAGGMVSSLCFVPSQKLGIAILTNNDNQSFFEALRYQILDAYLNVPYTNRSNYFLQGATAAATEQLQQIAEWKTNVTQPKTNLNVYQGTYNNILYGDIVVTSKGSFLQVAFTNHVNNLTATLQPMANGKWLLTYNNIEFGIHEVELLPDAKGKHSLQIKVNDFVEYDAYWFKKK
jgi:CubicO group peptidase (beta-lactamase class C family)